MILLDTNVVSAAMDPTGNAAVIAWLDRQPRFSVWVTAITVLEVYFGIARLPEEARRQRLERSFRRLIGEVVGGRVAPFDAAAAEESGRLQAVRERNGRPQDLRDTVIAGIAQARRATLATRNVRHFPDLTVAVVNPWIVTAP